MSDNRKRILICIDWYEPGFKAGGPIRSVANLVNALKQYYEFYILTSAYDLGEIMPYPNVPLNEWHDQNGVFVKYMDDKALNVSSVKGNIKEIEPDILYLNSLFSKLFTLAPLSLANRKKIKVVLAPRGMLGHGALAIKKSKKKLFLTLARYSGFYRKVTWHASTSEEESEIRKKFGKRVKVHVAQNIPIAQVKSLEEILNSKNPNEVRFVFISRIAVKKNLHFAIEALTKVKGNTPLFFDIYGNIEDEDYFNSFKDEIREHEHIKIEYKGVLNPVSIADVYMKADYMILPTHHENYGHAIVEAWANGCPVIISKNTPWKNLRIKDLGWDIEIDNIQNLITAIQESIDLDFTSYITMVRASFNYFEDKICDDSVMLANRNLFE